MKYLNLGCGNHYSTRSEWTNIDFVGSTDVIGHNLLRGIPFENDSFDLVYHSHVLEHFSKHDGDKLVTECFRVLKPGGTIRIAIPDLARIAKQYLYFLEKGISNPEDLKNKANYDWILIEMYDQTARSRSGGMMLDYLSQEKIMNEEFVFERIGAEGKGLRKAILAAKSSENTLPKNKPGASLKTRLVDRIKNRLLSRWAIDLNAHEIGKFRLGGEIHQWMYDEYSLTALLKSKGGVKIQVQDAFTSFIPQWSSYQLDGKDTVVRKPDSLFIEAIKQ
jgi:predicted SAM-dependent methyltransferase